MSFRLRKLLGPVRSPNLLIYQAVHAAASADAPRRNMVSAVVAALLRDEEQEGGAEMSHLSSHHSDTNLSDSYDCRLFAP